MPVQLNINNTTEKIRIEAGSRTTVQTVRVGRGAHQVNVASTPQEVTITPQETTVVKEVRLGRPVRRVQQTIGGATELTALNDVSIAPQDQVDGALLEWNSTLLRWVATRKLEKQDINGGHY